MTDREMLMMAYGVLKWNETSAQSAGGERAVVKMIEDYIWPKVIVMPDLNPNGVERYKPSAPSDAEGVK